MLRGALLFLCLAVVPCPASDSADRCDRVLSEQAPAASVSARHATTTRRPSEDVIRNAGTYDDLWSDVPPFDHEAILRGTRSVVSLGEGGSDFIETILGYRRRSGLPAGGVHAVDIAYSDPALLAHFTRHHPEAEEIRENVQRRLQAFPDRYHGQSFESLDIRDERGRRVRFDELVSSHALLYVLWKSEPAVQDAILQRMAEHAKPGARLRMWGWETPDPLALQRLKASRLVRDCRVENRRGLTVVLVTFP